MGFKKGNKVGKTFQPGETGNPDGRPVGAITFKSIAERLLDGKINIEQAGEMRQITRREKMILNIINDAVNDEDPATRLKAVAYLVERTEGKVADKVDMTSNGETLIPPLPTPAKNRFISFVEVRTYSCGADNLNPTPPIIPTKIALYLLSQQRISQKLSYGFDFARFKRQ